MTKPELAVKMLEEINEEQVIPYKYVLADSVYGENPGFIEAIESIIGVTYFLVLEETPNAGLNIHLSLKKNTSTKVKQGQKRF